jgi:Transcriptional regulator, AbiEi antitoxin
MYVLGCVHFFKLLRFCRHCGQCERDALLLSRRSQARLGSISRNLRKQSLLSQCVFFNHVSHPLRKALMYISLFTKSRYFMLNYLVFMKQPLSRLLTRHGGYITRQLVDEAGIAPHLLTRWVREGKLERVQRGVYRSPEAETLAHEDLLEVSLRMPYGVVCLRSALSFHGLTTYSPKVIDLAVPQNRYPPKLEYPPIQLHYFSEKMYQYGVEHHKLGAHSLQVYTIEKTLVDLLRFVNRYGDDLFFEGLKNYLTRRKSKPDLLKLMEAARVGRVEHKLRPILQALTYDNTT